MKTVSLNQIIKMLGVDLHPTYNPFIDILLTDSRSLTFAERTLFFALVTRKGDGHDYIRDLYARGVRAFVVSHLPEPALPDDAVVIKVPDTLKALQAIAAAYRSRLTMPVVGITGSNGKTTVKEIFYQLLHDAHKVSRSPRSYNSAIGVPLSVWGIDPESDLAFIEAGISKPDEMDVLEKIVRPNIGLITNIGDAHQENFSSLDQKCREKLRLFSQSEVIIYCLDDEIINRGLESLSLTHRTIGWSKHDPTAPVYAKSIRTDESGTTLDLIIMGQAMTYRIPYTDEGTINDTILVITALLKIAPTVVWEPERFSALEPISMRLEVIEGDKGITIINDTYNSDYDSLRIALDYLDRRNTTNRPSVLILSDLRESGTLPAELYKRIAGLVQKHRVKTLYTIGEELHRYASSFSMKTVNYRSTEDFLNHVDRDTLADHIILLKGSRAARFERIVSTLEKQSHQTILDVNLTSLAYNFNVYRELVPQGTKFVCMVKAFGYGAGSFEIAKTLKNQQVDYLAVAVVDEGKALREQGIDLPIIVMNPQVSSFQHLIEYRLQPEIYSMKLLKCFINAADNLGEHQYPIHLKWDTGMHRLGFDPSEVEAVADMVLDTPAVRVASIFSHLAASDDPKEDAFTRDQIAQLKEVGIELSQRIKYPFYRHILNTAGITRFSEHAMEMVRLGIGLYGISPLEHDELTLKPVCGLRTVILSVKTLPAGETVGYGRHGLLDRTSRIGVIPIGYADGIDRRLGNGHITFRTADGKLVPTIGNICMDTLMLDLTDAPNAVEGSEITIFDENLPITRISDAVGTIPYEILSRLSPRVARHYYNE